MSEAIYMRKATLNDLDTVMEIVENARALLKADGSEQWQGEDGYPTRLTFQMDIEGGCCWLLMYGNEIVGTATLMTQGDAHYMHIVNGIVLVTRLPRFTALQSLVNTAVSILPTTL